VSFGSGMVSIVEASRLEGLAFPLRLGTRLATEAFNIEVSAFEEARLPLRLGLALVGMKKVDSVLECMTFEADAACFLIVELFGDISYRVREAQSSGLVGESCPDLRRGATSVVPVE